MTFSRAPYLEWAKSRPPVANDLATSNVLNASVEDLTGAREALSFHGANAEGFPPLMSAIAQKYGVRETQIATASGTSGANFLTCLALVEAGDDVLVESPAYDPLIAAVRSLGGRVVRFARRFDDSYGLDLGAIEAAMTSLTRLIIVTNPHNPSGVVLSDDELDDLGRIAAEAKANVLVDEAYFGVALEAPDPTPAALRSPLFISTGSLTKIYGMNALRCGWAVAHADVAARIRRARDIVDNVGAVSLERLAALAFRHIDLLAARARRIVVPNFRKVQQCLEAHPRVEWIRPHAGTIAFPRITGVSDATAFVEHLRIAHGTAVVPGHYFDAPAHFRLAFGGDSAALDRGLDAISQALESEW